MSAAAKQDIRGWKAIKPMPQGGRYAHGCCEIDGHRMIIVGGVAARNFLASGMIYDARTELWTPLPNDMPEPLRNFGIAGNGKYVFVIGGMVASGQLSNTVYRLSLETYKWTDMAPMGTTRYGCAAVWKGDYIYVFDSIGSRLVDRYSIVDNAWESLSEMGEGFVDHYAIAGSGDDIYIVGGSLCIDSLGIFDTVSLLWKTTRTPLEIPAKKYAALLLLKDQYLVMISGWDADFDLTSDCLIYDMWSEHWSVTPSSIDMLTPRHQFSAAVLNGKVVIAGGMDDRMQNLSSAEFIDSDYLLEYAPLHYPLPSLIFNRILEIGKGDGDSGSRPSAGDVDRSSRKKPKTIQSNYGET